MPIDLALSDAAASHFRPGDTVRATAAWELDRVPKRVTFNLFYTTSGKGTTDRVIVATLADEAAPPSGRRDVSLTIPADAPATYDGRLLSLRWAVEAVTDKSAESAEASLIVSPTGMALVPQSLVK